MKYLARIEVNVWGAGLTTEQWEITREAGGTVYYKRDNQERRFNRADIGRIYRSKRGARWLYALVIAESPMKAITIRAVTWDMLQEIREELSAAKSFLEILEHNINMGDENEQGG